MAMLDLFRQQYLKGKVADKYSLSNGDLALVIRDETTGRRYHVEFRDSYKAPCLDNLYGLLKGPFSGKTEYLEKLIQEEDVVELTVSYSGGPLRQAYRIHAVSDGKSYQSKPAAANPYKVVRGGRC